MEKITYDNICDYIEKWFPEFVKSSEYDASAKETPYVFLGFFNAFVEKEWLAKSDERNLKRYFDFLNEFFESGSTAEDMVYIELLEHHRYGPYVEIYSTHLKGRARALFLKE
jgi:hypothetical protein